MGDELENSRAAARRLVATLDATELQVLHCLVRGMSVRQTATMAGLDAEHIERVRATMMQKLSARTTADAVRNGIYAGIDRSA